MRTTILMIFISFTLMMGLPGCTPESGAASNQATPPDKLIQLDGIYFGMHTAEFKPLVKIKKTRKKDQDSFIDFELHSYMGQAVRSGSTVFYDDRLEELEIQLTKASPPLFLKILKKKYGKPREARIPKTRELIGYFWELGDGAAIQINLMVKNGPWLYLKSATYSDKSKIRLKKQIRQVMQEMLSKKPAYTATFSCTVRQRHLPLVACLSQSNIKVHSGVKLKVYTAIDLGRDTEKKIPLKERFSIEARSSAFSRFVYLNITIRNKLEQIAYQDSVSPGGWINVGN